MTDPIHQDDSAISVMRRVLALHPIQVVADAIKEMEEINARVAELEQQKMAVQDVCLEYRDALSRLFDHAAEVRGYADGWEWKYGQAWDEEENTVKNLLYGCQAG